MATARETRAAWHRPPFAVHQQIEIPVAAVETSEATANNEALAVFAEDVTITSVQFIPHASQAGADTDSRDIVVRNLGDDGMGTTDIATFEQRGGADLTAYVPQEIEVDTGAATVAAGEVIAYRSVEVGTGVATPAGTFVITFDDDFSI